MFRRFYIICDQQQFPVHKNQTIDETISKHTTTIQNYISLDLTSTHKQQTQKPLSFVSSCNADAIAIFIFQEKYI